MSEKFCLRIDGCVEDEVTPFEETISSSLIDLPEQDECSMASPLVIKGKVHKAGEWVIFEACIDTAIMMPCSTCNESFIYPIHVDSWRVQECLSSVKDGFWDLSEQLREAVVIEFPFIAKCGGDSCNNFDMIKPYLRVEAPEEIESDIHQPFQTLLKEIKL